MNIILFDDVRRDYLLPLTFLRPVSEIRCGILTMREKWEKMFNQQCSFLTKQYLRKKFPFLTGNDNMFVNAGVFPSTALIEQILELAENEMLLSAEGILLAFRAAQETKQIMQISQEEHLNTEKLAGSRQRIYQGTILKINNLWDIFAFNGMAIEADFKLITAGRSSQAISSTNRYKGEEHIFIEEGANVDFSILNGETGKIYIGKDTEIMEQSVVRGPFALCDHSAVKMGAKIYGPTTIGPHCKVGGELNNVVFFGYSNKAHDGFLGNSVIAEWCNLGADTNNSNLKNTYETVKLWSYPDKSFVSTGLQFCGLIMGDHSKAAINTMFNTGTVCGINANVFGAGFPRNFIPSYTWGAVGGHNRFQFEKAIQIAQAVMVRRSVILSDTDIEIMKYIYDLTDMYS